MSVGASITEGPKAFAWLMNHAENKSVMPLAAITGEWVHLHKCHNLVVLMFLLWSVNAACERLKCHTVLPLSYMGDCSIVYHKLPRVGSWAVRIGPTLFPDWRCSKSRTKSGFRLFC